MENIILSSVIWGKPVIFGIPKNREQEKAIHKPRAGMIKYPDILVPTKS
jgi:hypothetical protein